MKIKRLLCIILSSTIFTGMLAGCSASGTAALVTVEPAPTPTPAATVLSAEKDAELQAALQTRIDDILSTDNEIIHSDNYIPGETYTGTAYYVSNDGNDNNDGLSPETAWQTAAKVGIESGENGVLEYGDAVFFRRGDIFRSYDDESGTTPLTLRTDGITYSAYGEGAKPIITGSSENGSGSEKWELAFESEDGAKIWKFYRDMKDISMIVCENGEITGSRVYEYYHDGAYQSCTMDVWWLHEDGGAQLLGELLPIEDILTENFTFVSRPERLHREENYGTSGVGPLYFRCDEGNPGELFTSIEFAEMEIFGLIDLGCSDVVIDNLSLRCTGQSFVKNWYHWKAVENTVIQNCEMAYGGGCVSHYFDLDGGDQGYVMAVHGDGIYCVVRNTDICNNYAHHCISGIATFEQSNFEMSEPTENFGYYRVTDNVFLNTLGNYFEASVDPELMRLDSFVFQGNQVWGTGNTANGTFTYPEAALNIDNNYYDECIIADNVFYGAKNGYPNVCALLVLDSYMDEDSGYSKPQFSNNTYVQYSGERFVTVIGNDYEGWYMDDDDLIDKAKNILGDETSYFYLIP